MREVVISTGSRLHFGLFAVNPELRRQFAGIGMMVDSPRVRLRVVESDSLQVDGPDEVARRVQQFGSQFCESFAAAKPVHIEVLEHISSHDGLGSGTQLALAVGTAIARLSNIECTSREVAMATGRGQRSTIGVFGFDHGGFIVDGGQTPDRPLEASLSRLDMPADWRLVLIHPTDTFGLSGAEEKAAFAELPPMSSELSERLDRLIAEDIVPALKGNQFAPFAESLHCFGQLIGNYFAPAQGHVFRSTQAVGLCSQMLDAGFKAVVQSSWGPTIAVLVENTSEAERAVALAGDLLTQIVAPMNAGASIEVA